MVESLQEREGREGGAERTAGVAKAERTKSQELEMGYVPYKKEVKTRHEILNPLSVCILYFMTDFLSRVGRSVLLVLKTKMFNSTLSLSRMHG